jgi:hypothetical protein
MTRSRRMKWAEHVPAMEGIRNACNNLLKKSEDISWKM